MKNNEIVQVSKAQKLYAVEFNDGIEKAKTMASDAMDISVANDQGLKIAETKTKEINDWAKKVSAYAKELREPLTQVTKDIIFRENQILNIVKKGKEGADEIKSMMTAYRNNPTEKINNSRVIKISDYEKQISFDIIKGTQTKIELIKSDVLQFFLDDGSKISIRPSGTEPKIKYYFSVNTKLVSTDKFEETDMILNRRIDDIIKYLKLN